VFRHKTKTYHEQLLNLLLVYRENIPSWVLNADYAGKRTLAVLIVTLIYCDANWSRYLIVFGCVTCHIWPRLVQQSDIWPRLARVNWSRYLSHLARACPAKWRHRFCKLIINSAKLNVHTNYFRHQNASWRKWRHWRHPFELQMWGITTNYY
jgi:hypothetical protein